MNRHIDRRDLSEYVGKPIEIHKEDDDGADEVTDAGRLIRVDQVETDDLTKDGGVSPSFTDTIVVVERENGERKERRLTRSEYVVDSSAV